MASPKAHETQILIDKRDRDLLKKLAKEDNRTMKGFVHQLLINYMEKKSA